MMKKYFLLLLLIIIPIALWLLMTKSCEGEKLSFNTSKKPIPECLLLPLQGWRVITSPQAIAPEFGNFVRYQAAETIQPVSYVPIPRHPLMASNGNNMHNDAYESDVNPVHGPMGINTTVQSRTQGFGGYGTITFDNKGRIIAVYGNARSFQLELLDPDSLEERASYDLPPRSIYFPLQGVMPWKYLGAGMYFYLDDQNRVIVPTTENKLAVIQTPDNPQDGFHFIKEYDLNDHVVKLPWPKLDSIAWVLPEWPREHTPRRYWYATIEGLVGAIDAESGKVVTWKNKNEIIENSFAVGEEGIFMMTDYAMYRLNMADQHIITEWRKAYDRGPAQKAGHITRGSGTSVTLVGTPETGLVVATDNAEPQIHVELYRRSNGEKVCRVPLFKKGESGTDLSALAFQHANPDGSPANHYSIMIENNYGHHSFPVPDQRPGIVRIDAIMQSDGTFHCEQIWQTQEAGIAGAKLALKSGLLYMHTTDNNPAMGNYFTAIDFTSGQVVYKQHTGMGHGYNTWQGVLFLHPSNGALYATSIFGLVKMQDQLY